ncbi:MAG: hypothetical protein UT32_C0025G0006 [Parcubacteria group bacterium GW2011_GWC2_39_14]|nr:MAG: hypothetical protein UT32_C0025G0006 [Parcubacteria group bacterium GW2011_GWC2_39_14]
MSGDLFHTVVTHRPPDLDALGTMVVTDDPAVKVAIGIVENPAFKFIPSGELRAEDWPGEPVLTKEALGAKGYLFVDVVGGQYDHHNRKAAAANPRKASILLLAEAAGVLEDRSGLASFVQVVSDQDCYAISVCSHMMVDPKSDTPHVPRDLKTLVAALNDRYPDDPETVRRIFFQCVEGLQCLFNKIDDGECDDIRILYDEDGNVDLRSMNFLTVDNAARGLQLLLENRHGDSDQVDQEIDSFWETVTDAWQGRETEWREAEDAVRDAAIYKLVYRRPIDEVEDGDVVLLVGHSDSKCFGTAARRGVTAKSPINGQPFTKRGDIALQFFSDGRFIITMMNGAVSLNRVVAYLRVCDLKKRHQDAEIKNLRHLDSVGTSKVELPDGSVVDQFYYPKERSSFGNRFNSNPKGHAVSVLTEEEVLFALRGALECFPLGRAVRHCLGQDIGTGRIPEYEERGEVGDEEAVA